MEQNQAVSKGNAQHDTDSKMHQQRMLAKYKQMLQQILSKMLSKMLANVMANTQQNA